MKARENPDALLDDQLSEETRGGPVPTGQAEPRRGLRISTLAALVLFIAALSVAALWGVLSDRNATTQRLPVAAPTALSSEPPTPMPSPDNNAYVHVLGQVRVPGLYTVATGARVIDAVGAAGGVTARADMAAINLARVVVDGEQLYVPAEGESPPLPAAGAPSENGSGLPGGLLNINTATSDQLEELPRVGPALAQRIVDWRKSNGAFTSVDGLLGVSGIGEKTLDGFRDLITV
ncbi:hypothetical protein GCM10022198_04930 [Klugiella xanthotipulae]|uniref:Competence protein ComEA n=1 Tax=Klugiella xanthotipulae TaxID=244735 RepID=A0A543HSE6_9MICO|nr:helix-hairpin-helix domain-containing protein [Klugiella xanthotipulae]TQM61252.1 competence protein ComEA [Klugiella xanthotipulae]